MAFGLLAIAVTATAFRRGDGWAWWALLVGNTIAIGTAIGRMLASSQPRSSDGH